MASMDETEVEHQAAQRITPEQIEAAMVSAQYWRPPGTLLTVCALTMRNGFTVIGESGAVSADGFDVQIGQSFALENARAQVGVFLGFALKDRIYREALAANIAPRDRYVPLTRGWTAGT